MVDRVSWSRPCCAFAVLQRCYARLTLGDFSVYKMKDVEKLVIRAKHGPTKEELATLPQYEKFRLYHSEFRGAGKAASFISHAIFAFLLRIYFYYEKCVFVTTMISYK